MGANLCSWTPETLCKNLSRGVEAVKTADSGFLYVLNVSLNPFCLFVLTAGAALGAVNGLRMGLKETRDMAWSKPRNVQ